MSVALAAFQSGLAGALRGEAACPIAPDSAGFRFTRIVWRSWCERRTLRAARAVFALLPPAERQRLVGDYIDRGGGTAAFQQAESDELLPFLAARLPDPSHALTLCRMDMALARARAASMDFVPPPGSPGPIARHAIARHAHADLVWLHCDPALLAQAVDGGPMPPIGAPETPILFAPGVENLCRAATADEAALWARLPTADVGSHLAAQLLAEGVVATAEG